MRSKLSFLSGPIAIVLLAGSPSAADDVLPIYDGVGGEFSADSTLGREVSLSEFRGKVVLLFFGYTSCQEICPTTLSHLKSLVGKLGPSAEGTQVLFATVDPEIDTVEHLRAYLARFDSRFIGVTGDPEKLDSLAKLFLVKREKTHGIEVSTRYSPREAYADSAYLYTHSQQIFLLDKRGRTRALFFSGSPIEEMVTAIHQLLKE